MPGIILAILVCGSCLALVLNEYWLTSTLEELRTSTQSTALAAARQLASDNLLQNDVDWQEFADHVREAGEQQATKNQVAGPHAAQVDIHVGRVLFDPATGQRETQETDVAPNSVVVIGHRDRSRRNPMLMLAPALSGHSVADVTVNVEASVTNLIEGLRPFGVVNVPAWPLAILESSPDSDVKTWVSEIEQNRGTDTYRWNAETQEVEAGPDGLREILLLPNGKNGTNNLFLVNVGSGFQDEELARQFRNGWSTENLSSFGDMLTLKAGPINLPASPMLLGTPFESLGEELGQMRILLLYSTVTAANGQVSVHISRMVAGRLMRVGIGSEGPEFIIQPAVIATRTAVLDEDALYDGVLNGNRYIYKLSITQ